MEVKRIRDIVDPAPPPPSIVTFDFVLDRLWVHFFNPSPLPPINDVAIPKGLISTHFVLNPTLFGVGGDRRGRQLY